MVQLVKFPGSSGMNLQFLNFAIAKTISGFAGNSFTGKEKIFIRVVTFSWELEISFKMSV